MKIIKDVMVELKDGKVLRMSEEGSVKGFIEQLPFELKNAIFEEVNQSNSIEDIKVSLEHLQDLEEIPSVKLSQEDYLLILEIMDSRYDANIDYNSQIEEAIMNFFDQYEI